MPLVVGGCWSPVVPSLPAVPPPIIIHCRLPHYCCPLRHRSKSTATRHIIGTHCASKQTNRIPTKLPTNNNAMFAHHQREGRLWGAMD